MRYTFVHRASCLVYNGCTCCVGWWEAAARRHRRQQDNAMDGSAIDRVWPRKRVLHQPSPSTQHRPFATHQVGTTGGRGASQRGCCACCAKASVGRTNCPLTLLNYLNYWHTPNSLCPSRDICFAYWLMRFISFLLNTFHSTIRRFLVGLKQVRRVGGGGKKTLLFEENICSCLRNFLLLFLCYFENFRLTPKWDAKNFP